MYPDGKTAVGNLLMNISNLIVLRIKLHFDKFR